MSDLNDLIHRNAQLAYAQGEVNEHRRIVQLIESVASESLKLTVTEPKSKDNVNRQKLAAVCYHLIALIKGEQK